MFSNCGQFELCEALTHNMQQLMTDQNVAINENIINRLKKVSQYLAQNYWRISSVPKKNRFNRNDSCERFFLPL